MFPLGDLFSQAQQKLQESFECGICGETCMIEEFVQLQLFQTRKFNECPKRIGFVSNFINFLGKKKKCN